MKNADIVQGCIHPHGENRAWNYRAYEHLGEEALHVDSSEMNWSYDPRQHLCHTCLFPSLSDLHWKSAGPSYNFQLDSVADSLLCSMQFLKLLLSKKNHSFPSLFYLPCMCCKGEVLEFFFFFQFQWYRIDPAHEALWASLVAHTVKESSCYAGVLASNPWSGRSPGGGHGNPLQYSCLEHPMDRGAWRVIVHGVAKSLTRLSD